MIDWDFNQQSFEKSQEILKEIISKLVEDSYLSVLPKILYHYTSLEVAERILQNDDIRLSHAEYSNDQQEMEQAKRVIQNCLITHSGTKAFLDQVETDYASRASGLDAYIFCMSEGGPQSALSPQDLLSQWRAYGQDGRGACITLDSPNFAKFTPHLPGLRINPIIYKTAIQTKLVNAILDKGDQLFLSNHATAVGATVAALVFATPLMKAEGFSEEREWRLIFMPSPTPHPTFSFYPRRDFLAPYITFKTLCDFFNYTPPTKPVVPVTGIMVGPSGHQPLNGRAIDKVLAQAGHPFKHTHSVIPYRSMS